MEKKTYSKPTISAQRFEPQEYCAPCGDGQTEVTYYFMCDGGWGDTPYNVWLDDSPKDNKLTGEWRLSLYTGGWTWGYNDNGDRDTWLTSGKYYHSCNKTHTVTVPKGTSVEDIFPYGFLQEKYDRNGEVIPVRLWRGDGSIHATRTLNSSEFTPHNPS